MLADLNELEDGAAIAADVCVIGAGAAGITVARAFLNTPHDVCLLESGGNDYEERVQSLYEGRNLGMPYYDLVESRLRLFGGTTAIWGGRCAPLDAIDFEKREWVPHSGWPFDRAHLDPWYERAHALLGLGACEYDERVWRSLGDAPPGFDPEVLRNDFWRFDLSRDRFTLNHCRDLANAANVRIVLHANAVRIQAGADARNVEHVDVASLQGRRAKVRARLYVLACGGIENPRLLLASNNVETQGIGNGHDRVGRFFMEHPHGRAGRINSDRPHELWSLFRRRPAGDGTPVALTLRPGEELQRRKKVLNSSMTIKLQREPKRGLALNKYLYQQAISKVNPTREARYLLHLYKRLRARLANFVRPSLERLRIRAGMRHLFLIVRGEQSPNPQSRVLLSTERDAFGAPRADLDWRLSALDKTSVARQVEALDVELRRLGLGRIEPSEWLRDGTPQWPVDPTVSNHPIAGYHHMGTTRMHDDPRRGVVNVDSRVHHYGNLYVAGSSVFPTSGWANPTLTILALSLRLGDHLRRRLENN
ncbi:MAG: GMC family oxidoreductase [Gammaproteobacteria bacterium]|nr:GMC family oxidoreductase [Gammaproteobacteria bacterium]